MVSRDGVAAEAESVRALAERSPIADSLELTRQFTAGQFTLSLGSSEAAAMLR